MVAEAWLRLALLLLPLRQQQQRRLLGAALHQIGGIITTASSKCRCALMARICVLWLAVVEIHARSWLMSRGELELEILCIEGWYEGGRGVVPLTKTTCPEPSLCYFLPPLFCFPLLLLLTLPLSYSLLFFSPLAWPQTGL